MPRKIFLELVRSDSRKLSAELPEKNFVGNVVNLSEMSLFGLVIRPNEVVESPPLQFLKQPQAYRIRKPISLFSRQSQTIRDFGSVKDD